MPPGSGPIEVKSPLPEYTLRSPFNTVVNNGHLESAIDASGNGTRYFTYPVEMSGQQIAVGRVSVDSMDRARVIGISVPQPFIADALARVASFDQVREGLFEVRLLGWSVRTGFNPGSATSVFNTYTVIWLKSDLGGVDQVYVPVLPGNLKPPDGLRADTLYRMDDFVKSLIPPSEPQP
jgi:hypothetical protein